MQHVCLPSVCLCLWTCACMCVILFQLNANRHLQIKKIVLEQYSIIDFSCTLPVGWHPYYTDKWSKSQGCVSMIKPLRGIDPPPKIAEIEVPCGEICHANVFSRVQWVSRRRSRGFFFSKEGETFKWKCHFSLFLPSHIHECFSIILVM